MIAVDAGVEFERLDPRPGRRGCGGDEEIRAGILAAADPDEALPWLRVVIRALAAGAGVGDVDAGILHRGLVTRPGVVDPIFVLGFVFDGVGCDFC